MQTALCLLKHVRFLVMMASSLFSNYNFFRKKICFVRYARLVGREFEHGVGGGEGGR